MSSQARIHPDVILDGRLAIFHERAGWLAVADLHFGYEVELRRAGALFPLWGMQRIETRLRELVDEYEPSRLILLGDIVHGKRAAAETRKFCELSGSLAPEVSWIAGNHDRGPIERLVRLEPSISLDGFFFHHGHLDLEPAEGQIEVRGHAHPAILLSDGAGLRLKLPAFVQEEENRWILPAFSPWAGGSAAAGKGRRWVCSPKRVFEIGKKAVI